MRPRIAMSSLVGRFMGMVGAVALFVASGAASALAQTAPGSTPTATASYPAAPPTASAALPNVAPQPIAPAQPAGTQPPIAPTGSQPNPPDPVLAWRTQRLGGTLQKLADNSSGGWATALCLFNGVAYTGLGAVIAFGWPDEHGVGDIRAIGATMAMLIGAPSLAIGIYGLTDSTTSDEIRLARFQRNTSTRVLSAAEIARYEGELQAIAAYRRSMRIVEGVIGIGLAAGGAAMIAFTAASPHFDTATARGIGYAEGGVLLVYGTILGIAELSSESATETEWRSYRQYLPEESLQKVRIGLAPAVSPHGVTLSLVGSF